MSGEEQMHFPVLRGSAQKSVIAGAIRKRLLYILDHPHAIELPPELAAVSWLHIAAQLLVYADCFVYRQ